MKCQSCGKRDAKVHVTEIDDANQKRELHLCENCHGQSGTDTTLETILAGALSTSLPSPPELACTACRLPYAEFRNRGRLGCPECYTAFAEALDQLLGKIHNAKRHTGKAPGDGSNEQRTRSRRLVEARRRLQEAIEREDFEAAARLRDDLRALEEGTAVDADRD
jgi:protein arginine kinase activator